jgi:hypothetical protein
VTKIAANVPNLKKIKCLKPKQNVRKPLDFEFQQSMLHFSRSDDDNDDDG